MSKLVMALCTLYMHVLILFLPNLNSLKEFVDSKSFNDYKLINIESFNLQGRLTPFFYLISAILNLYFGKGS
jgi:hypothetical protein